MRATYGWWHGIWTAQRIAGATRCRSHDGGITSPTLTLFQLSRSVNDYKKVGAS